MLRLICLSLALITFTVPALAQRETVLPDVPEALQGLVERGAQIRYLGKEHGLDGWIAIYQGQEQYYYVTSDKKAFVTGLMFGADGRPITIEQVKDLQSQSGPVLDLLAEGSATAPTTPEITRNLADTAKLSTPSERMFADVENSNWVRLGNQNAPVIYSFVDPQCPHCHELMKDLRASHIDTGLLQLRIIPVGFQQGSLAQSSFLLAAPNAAELWYKHLDGDKDALPAKSDVSTQAIQKNMALMQAWKFNVTPLNVYRGKDGTVKIVAGRIKDINAVMNDLPQAVSGTSVVQ
jgi:thiol:disulfide interchange protein DsbG